MVVVFDTNLILELLPAPELNPAARQLPALALPTPRPSLLLKPGPSVVPPPKLLPDETTAVMGDHRGEG